MKQKTSYFNKSLFLINLKTVWPIWTIVTIGLLFFPLLLVENLADMHSDVSLTSEVKTIIMGMITGAIPVLTFLYAPVCAVLSYNYLHFGRKVDMFHQIPVSRKELYITNFLSGYVMTMLPFVVTGTVTVIALCFFKALPMTLIFEAIIAVFLEGLLFFSLGVFASMLVGNVVAVPFVYLIINFIATITEGLVDQVITMFIVGVSDVYTGVFEFLSPLYYLFEKVTCSYVYVFDEVAGCTVLDTSVSKITGFENVIYYGVAGLFISIFTYFIYKQRKSETAGDVVSFGVVKNVLHIATTIVSVIGASVFFYYLISDANKKVTWLIIFMIIFTVIGYYMISMIVNKTVRVFTKQSVIAVFTIGALLTVFACCCTMDVFGYEKYIPDKEDIEYAEYDTYGVSFIVYPSDEAYDILLDIHKNAINEMKYYEDNMDYMTNPSSYIRITYTLKNGKKVERNYTYIYDTDNEDISGSFENKNKELLKNEDVVNRVFHINDAYEIDYCSLNYRNDDSYYVTYNATDVEMAKIYEALILDYRDGNINMLDDFCYDADMLEAYSVDVYLEFVSTEETPYARGVKDLRFIVNNKNVNTMNALKELKIIK